ncbi:putative NAD(P)H dehydrogenase (quinone) FQR1-like 2 [Curcuma longa]|uniref:putative NAD(P)H dehydrogenase (quinone) FQR1-like 2 n=1 Tax=Curcuma longa TaxID=136217 RepID=UPI003D9FA9C7
MEEVDQEDVVRSIVIFGSPYSSQFGRIRRRLTAMLENLLLDATGVLKISDFGHSALPSQVRLTHHWMLFVPSGFTFGAGMLGMDEIRGGSPYGAGVFSGDGSKQASEAELALAEYQGKYMASVVNKMAHT